MTTTNLQAVQPDAAEAINSAQQGAKSHTYPPLKEAFRQPKPVWAIAFATTVSFMGIGLVDPILPAISHELGASPSQAMLLFTSYLIITAIAMFFTSWVSSRLGVRKTLLLGLALVVTFALACSLSNSVNQIIGWRAGWGLGNALFISTALAAIVAAAYGGSAGAIILYESALGIGMAVGPLAGGVLGSISWRGPFLGTAILMGIGLVAIAVLYPRKAKSKVTAAESSSVSSAGGNGERVSILAGVKALREPALRTLALTALFYNMAFFILLAYSPFPLEAAAASLGKHFGELELGLVFFGWGLGLAIASVGAAPILTRKIGLIPTLVAAMIGVSLLLLVAGLSVNNLAGLIAAVILCGVVLGIVNTALTEAVMDATTLPRNIASSAYSGVRFFGGAISSALAGSLAAATTAAMPYWVGAGCMLIATLMLFTGRNRLHRLTDDLHLSAEEEAQAIGAGAK